MASDDVVVLLTELANRPGDAELRRRVAETLDERGRRDEAVAVLAPLVNLTGHDLDAELPCLCKRCLPTAGTTATSHDLAFVRSFAVAGTRVLHFWMLADQEPMRAKVRASVTEALRTRLGKQKERA